MQIRTVNQRLHIPPRSKYRPAELNQPGKFGDQQRSIKGIWNVEEIWPQSTVFVIGGGPSVVSMPIGLLKGQYVIGVNSAFRACSWIPFTFFGDSRWFKWEYKALKKYTGTLVTCQAKLENPDELPVKRLVKGRKAQGISIKRYEVSWNNSSGGAAINLAYHLGARRIVLIGYDMKPSKSKHNFHDAYPVGKPERNPYIHFLRAFSKIKNDADKLGVEILNATPDSAIECFPFVKLEEVIRV